MRVQDSLSALENLRKELDAMTSNESSGSASQNALERSWSMLEGDLDQVGTLTSVDEDGVSSDDGLRDTMESLKMQISTLASAVKDYSAVSRALQVGFAPCTFCLVCPGNECFLSSRCWKLTPRTKKNMSSLRRRSCQMLGSHPKYLTRSRGWFGLLSLSTGC